MNKRCTKCLVEKSLDAFHKDAGKPGGKHSHCKECRATYRKTPVSKAKQAISRMRHNGMPIDLSAYEIMWTLGDCRCSYCGTELAYEDTTLDHITPTIRQGANTFENTTVSCKSCNSSKGDRPALLFLLTDCQPYYSRKLLVQMALRRGGNVSEVFVDLAMDTQRHFEQRQAGETI